jgi:hypothetical protein
MTTTTETTMDDTTNEAPARPAPADPLDAVLDDASVLLGADARLVAGRDGYALVIHAGGVPLPDSPVPPVPRSIEVWDRPWSDTDRTMRGRKWVRLSVAPALAHALRKPAAGALAEQERAVAAARKALARAEQSLAEAQARRDRLAGVVTAALAALGETGEPLT